MCGTSSPASRLVDLVRQHWQKENVDLEKRNIFRSGSVGAATWKAFGDAYHWFNLRQKMPQVWIEGRGLEDMRVCSPMQSTSGNALSAKH